MTKLGLAVAVLFSLFSAQSFADNHIDTRGYEQCERALNKTFTDNGVVFKRQYMVKRSEANRTYYINKTIWNEGVRTPVSSTCITSANGRDVVAMQSDFRPHVSIEDLVAAR